MMPAAPAVPLLAHYRVLEEVYATPLSRVYVAEEEERAGHRVALKLLNRDAVDGDRIADTQLAAERRLQLDVQHPHVLRTLAIIDHATYDSESGRRQRVGVVAMELMSGSLVEHLLPSAGGSAFGESLARTFCLQLVRGLLACHKAGFAHRDLKPDNLLLDAAFNLKVADFGTSLRVPPMRWMGTYCGTPTYMAPEVSNLMYDGQLADAWSVGVILFVMVAGWPPFERADSTSSWYRLLLRGHSGFFSLHKQFHAVFSPELEDLLTQLLQVDPGSRLSVQRMQQHPWLAGPQLSPQVLQLEMQGRLHRLRNPAAVREAALQAHAQAQEQQQQRPEQPQTNVAVVGDLQRAGSEQEREAAAQLPPLAPPSLGPASLCLAAALARHDRAEGSNIRPSRAGDQTPLDWQQERKERVATPRSAVLESAIRPRATVQQPPSRLLTAQGLVDQAPTADDASLPVYDPELALPALTPLFSCLPAAELQQQLRTLLLLNHFRTVSDDKQRSLTASIQAPSGAVRMRLQLWRDGEQKGRIRLELRRLQGDSAQCRQLFADLLLQMDDSLVE